MAGAVRFPRPDTSRIACAATRRGTLALLITALLAVCGATPALAQDVPPEDRDVEDEASSTIAPTAPPSGVEVIRIRGKTISAVETEVPTSVTQFDAATIAALGAQNVSDLARVTPNVEIRSSGATTATFFIRGVGLSDFNANAAGAVAIYQDDVAMNSPALQLGQLFDLADVQVLRGPQGSGAGRNASAGAIKIVSRKPSSGFEGALRAELSNSSQDPRTGALFAGRDFEGALQVPLVEDTLSSRFAFRFTQKDPFRKNGCSTRYLPSQEERIADYPSWVGVNVCGINNALQRIPEDRTLPVIARITKVDPVPEHKVGDTNNWAARGQLRFQPKDTGDVAMDFLLNLHGSRLDQQSTLGEAFGTNQNGFGTFSGGPRYRDPDIVEMERKLIDQGLSVEEAQRRVGKELARNLDSKPYRGDYNRIGQTKLDTWGTFLRGDFEFGDSLQLTSITGYDSYDRMRETDQDFTPIQLFEALIDDQGWQVTQDVRLSGELEEESLRWSLGGFYLQETIDSDTGQFFGANSPQVAISIYQQNTWSFGVYAGFEWDFLDDFTLEMGGRYNFEKKDFDFELTRGPNSRTQIDDRVWQAPTGTVSLTYRFSPEVSVYSKLSRGWKGGHFNGSANILEGIEPARPETLTAAETGFRARALDGRLDLNGAFFYYRYEDYQVFQFENNLGAPPLLQIINADDAEQYGFELTVVARPLEDWVPDLFDGLKLETTVGWLRSQFLDFTQTQRGLAGMGVPTQETIDFSGNPLINSPEWKVVIAAEWRLDFGRYGAVIPRYDAVWTDDIFFDASGGRGIPNANGVQNLPEYAIGQRAHWMHNIRLAYQAPGGHLEFAGWIRNLEDKVVKTYAFDASRFSQVVINFVGEPRTYGFSFSFKF